jgi:hypothetical protein
MPHGAISETEKESVMITRNIIIHANRLNALHALPAESIDFILTDPTMYRPQHIR